MWSFYLKYEEFKHLKENEQKTSLIIFFKEFSIMGQFSYSKTKVQAPFKGSQRKSYQTLDDLDDLVG